jgi:hypothetical protein
MKLEDLTDELRKALAKSISREAERVSRQEKAAKRFYAKINKLIK